MSSHDRRWCGWCHVTKLPHTHAVEGYNDVAALLQSLRPRSLVKVQLTRRDGFHVLDLLSCGPTGGTCYMQETGSWPRSFRYAEIITAEVVEIIGP